MNTSAIAAWLGTVALIAIGPVTGPGAPWRTACPPMPRPTVVSATTLCPRPNPGGPMIPFRGPR